MEYIFDQGDFPNLTKTECLIFNTDEEAIRYAKDNDYDYTWKIQPKRNSVPIYEKNPKQENIN